MEFPIKTVYKFLLIWVVSIAIFIGSIFITLYISILFAYSLYASLASGVLSFLAACHVVTKFHIDFFESAKLPKVIRYILFFLILPIVLTIYIVRAIKSKDKISRILQVVLLLLIFSSVWVGGILSTGIIGANQLGLIDYPIMVSGTGSMYPTFPKGQTKTPKEQGEEVVATAGMFPYPNGLVIFNKKIFGHQIGRGDIVVVENESIRNLTEKLVGHPAGWIKRVIGVPGDNLEIKNGIVYINEEPLKEPYTAKPQSTFGQSFLTDCQTVTVPQNSIFIMGDNRKGSGDSREIGFVAIGDVKYVLPFKKQYGNLDKTWRDTTEDFDDSSKIRLDKFKYLELLNEQRKKAGLEPLKYQIKLEQSAAKRGNNILKFNDFSYEATKSGYTVENALSDSGYSNITWNEGISQGYFEADELMEYLLEFPLWKSNLLLEDDFQEFGIAEVEGLVNGCPTQVIVQHTGGYVPPDYQIEDIEAWKKILNDLKKIQPGWQELKNYEDFYKDNKVDIDRLNAIISSRITNIEAIIAKMQSNEWLTKQQMEYITLETDTYNEQNSLAEKLNSR